MGCFHSDTSAFTALPHFASVITLAKCRYPFENSASLAKQPPRPPQGRDFPLKPRHHLQNDPSVRTTGPLREAQLRQEGVGRAFL